jgi:hypothetical protein
MVTFSLILAFFATGIAIRVVHGGVTEVFKQVCYCATDPIAIAPWLLTTFVAPIVVPVEAMRSRLAIADR